MPKAISLLTEAWRNSTVTAETTATLSPAAGSKVVVHAFLRSQDGASVAAETPAISGCATTWTLVESIVYDSASQCMHVMWEGEGPFTAEAATYGFASARSIRGTGAIVLQLTADGTPIIVQAVPAAPGNVNVLPITLAAFADPANFTVLAVGTNFNTVTFVEDASPAGWTALTPNSADIHFAQYLGEDDTAPEVSLASGAFRRMAAIAWEFGESGGGPPGPGFRAFYPKG
jgi:hypothetical protein